MRSATVDTSASNTPNGPVFIPSTPSDRRSLKNAVSILRRHGIPIPRGHKNTKKRLDYLQKTRPVDPEVWDLFIRRLERPSLLGSPLPSKSPVDKLIPWDLQPACCREVGPR